MMDCVGSDLNGKDHNTVGHGEILNVLGVKDYNYQYYMYK